MEDFAIHLPLIIIAEMMGLDPEQRDRLYRWSDAMMAGDGHIDADSPQLHAAAEAFGEYAAMCAELIEERRGRHDLDDLISILTNAKDEGALAQGGMAADLQPVEDGGLSSDELFMFLTLLVVAGNETTRNALTGGMLAFSLFPDQKEKLLANPDLIDLAVDEIVRYVSPVMTFNRTVTETHEYKGRTLEEGDKVLMLYQSANRDEDVFEAPDEFRIDRDPNPHLGFGIGTHFCLGANLARAEVKTVFTELFARLRDIGSSAGAPLDARRLHARARPPAPARAVFTPAGRWPATAPTAAAAPSRQRILDAALALMSEHGVGRHVDAAARRRVRAERRDAVPPLPVEGRPASGPSSPSRATSSGCGTDEPPADAAPRWARRRPASAGWSRGCGGRRAGGGRVAPADRREPPRRRRPPGTRRWSWSTASTSPSPPGSPRSCPSSPTGPRPSPALVRATLFALMVEHLALGPDDDRAQRTSTGLVELLV